MSDAVEYRTLDRLPGYRFGDDGSVWCCLNNKYGPSDKWRRLKCCISAYGYRIVYIWTGKTRHTYHVHRLVLEAFVGPCPEGMEGCHNNGVKLDNRLANLRWDTRKANAADQKKHGTAAVGTRNGHAVLDANKVREARRLRADGITYREIGQRFGVTPATVCDAVKGRNWRHVI